MAEKDIVFTGKIKQKSLFNFSEFYEFCYMYMKDQGYYLVETEYKEQIAGEAKNIEIQWDLFKDVSDYFRFEIQMRWRVTGLTKTKAKQEEKEIDINKGTIELKFKGVLTKDYENRWEDHPLWKFMRGVYERYIIRGRIEQYQGKVYEELQELIDQIKAYLAIEGKRQQ